MLVDQFRELGKPILVLRVGSPQKVTLALAGNRNVLLEGSWLE